MIEYKSKALKKNSLPAGVSTRPNHDSVAFPKRKKKDNKKPYCVEREKKEIMK